jgi:outer membrane protein insertion porin family
VERVDSTSNGATSRYSFVPTGGKASLTLNLEWREPFEKWRGGYGVVFLDGGQVWANTKSIAIKDIQWALGAGIRYRAPIGPIRMDLAYKLNPSSEDLGIIPGIRGKQSWVRWALYVSIGEAF